MVAARAHVNLCRRRFCVGSSLSTTGRSRPYADLRLGDTMSMSRASIIGSLSVLLFALPAAAQEREKCTFVCAPELKFEPTLTFVNLFNRPQLAGQADGLVFRQPRGKQFEIVLALDIPTALPRLAFAAESIWTPFKGTSENPFTGTTAQDLGVKTIRDNPVELEFEANFYVLMEKQTRGWVQSHLDIVDQFSPAQRPLSKGIYTHKLDFEWDTSLALFKRLPPDRWLRGVELEGSLDYQPGGLPRRGDSIDGEVFLGNASRWSFSAVLVVPIAPIP